MWNSENQSSRKEVRNYWVRKKLDSTLVLLKVKTCALEVKKSNIGSQI